VKAGLRDVVILNDHASINGGSTAVALAAARGLAARGVAVTLFSCVGPVDPALAALPNLRVVCLDQPEHAKDPHPLRAMASGLRNARAVDELRALLAALDPRHTIVHAQSWTKAMSPFALGAALDMGFPLVLTLHDFFITCPTGSLYVHRRGEICHRTPGSFNCLSCHCDRHSVAHKMWRNARTLIQNRVLRVPGRAAHFVGVSDFSLNLMRPHLPRGASAAVIRNPVDCVDRGLAPVAWNTDFLFIGRFTPEKGVRVFAEAVRKSGVPATFIGDGDLMPEIRAMCPQARFTGWLPAGAIRDWLQRARALVFPPLWYETLGLVVVEAAGAGVPAIVAGGCAATDFIRNRANGLHFVQGSADSLAAAMGELRDDDALASRLGRAAYDWYWSDPWTLDAHVSALLDLYGNLVGDAHSLEEVAA